MEDKFIMKNIHFITCCALISIIGYSCSLSDQNNNGSNVLTVDSKQEKVENMNDISVQKNATTDRVEDASNSEDRAEIIKTEIPEKPKPSEKRRKIEEKESLNSVFFDLGCCKDEIKRTNECCCDAVLVKYKELIAKDIVKLGMIKMKDPILSKCLLQYKSKFEKVDDSFQEEDDGPF